MSQEQHQWRKSALFVVVGTMAALVASGYILGRPSPPSDADIRNCAVEMIENRDVPVGPEDKCAAYVKPISVQVRRSRREHFGDFLLSRFFITVDTTVQMKSEIARGKPWYPGIECILPYRSSHPDDHVFAVGDEAVVKQHLRLTKMSFWRSKPWRCDSETR
jgi:hypothetical protein